MTLGPASPNPVTTTSTMTEKVYLDALTLYPVLAHSAKQLSLTISLVGA